ncbi:MAG: hypothetical protein Hens3KO_11000 [Henriciella sp.]
MKKSQTRSNQKKSNQNWMKERPLGEALRESYQDVTKEPVPERLTKLMEKMRQRETKC